MPSEEVFDESTTRSDTLPIQTENAMTVGTDPTVAHAGLTEIDVHAAEITNGAANITSPNAPLTGNTDSAAANAAAEAHWDSKAPGQDDMSASAESFDH